ncbi:hypothetical protein [Lewinella sp. IMCC34183]|uniref:hypothetical protein n=1 Tax=Lewinella sp. IMCC34183 TaxID=2248762 RepID=UPI000E253AF5|nr:hypothetical protein [Lewinella sp. IMCC34183]
MRYAILLSILLLAGCQRDVYAPELSDCIAVGEPLTLPDGHQLTLSRVDNGYCPCNANCVWEGNLVAELDDAEGKRFVADRLSGGSPDLMTHVAYRGFTISIDTVGVFPGACDPAQIPQADYCISFTVVQE